MSIGTPAPNAKANRVKKLMIVVFWIIIWTITVAKIGPAQGAQIIAIKVPKNNPLKKLDCLFPKGVNNFKKVTFGVNFEKSSVKKFDNKMNANNKSNP